MFNFNKDYNIIMLIYNIKYIMMEINYRNCIENNKKLIIMDIFLRKCYN